MRMIGVLAWNTWQENLRNKFFLLALVFGGIVLYLSLLLGLLASDQEVRVLLDFGLSFIELLGLAGAVYGAATPILREMETKTVYLILTRPVSRLEYLLGRFAGLMLSVLAAMVMMAVIHLGVLFMKGWAWTPAYGVAFLGAFLKVLVTAAIAEFLALFSTSVLSGLTMTLILWSLGHFIGEIRFLIAHQARHSSLILPLNILSYIMPNLKLFNLRDRMDRTSLAALEAPLAVWFGYALVYCGAWLAAAYLRLRRREF